jgi:lambda family phage portal protein
VLEADFLDTSKHGITTPGGGRITYGVETNAIGQRVAYWLYPEHPGNSFLVTPASVRIPAEGVLHVYKPTRPGAARGASWFAPVLLRMKDFDEFEDATLMKQKIAACLAVILSDVDGTAAPMGAADDEDPTIDWLEPGIIKTVSAGKSIDIVPPPSATDYPAYAEASLRSQAAGLGVTYEDFTGDYAELPFSAARMSRLRIGSQVDDRRWRMLVPQFCDPVWTWAMRAAAVMGLANPDALPVAHWTAPPMPMIEPDKEGLAYQRLIRSSLMTLSEAIRERGYDPDEVFAEAESDNKKLDKHGLVSDSDPRKMTQQGLAQKAEEPDEPAAPAVDSASAERLHVVGSRR